MDSDGGPGGVKVSLNIYDLNSSDGNGYVTAVNKYAQPGLGIGAFHSGVHIHGLGEFGFGMIESGTGVFKCEPQKCLPEKYKFRESVEIGVTEFSIRDCELLVNTFARSANFQGTAYDLTRNNCNHFSNDLCKELTGTGIPNWVNRGAEALDVVRGGVEYTAQTVNNIANSETVTAAKKRLSDVALATSSAVRGIADDPRTIEAVEATKSAVASGISSLGSFLTQCMDTVQSTVPPSVAPPASVVPASGAKHPSESAPLLAAEDAAEKSKPHARA